jgi:DNA-binding GntR family transcriptional regulator
MPVASTAMSATNPKSPLGTAGQHTLDALRTAIVSGQLRPGDRIRQDEVAESFGVSIAPLREALAVLEKEGQVTYLPRRGYFVAELHISDLQEIYELRAILEERAVRSSLPQFEEDAIERIRLAARECAAAATAGDVTAELQANRRFHLGLLESADHPHTLRVIRQLWDSTEAYRALYYNSPDERGITLDAHTRILAALDRGDADALVAELHSHRQRALDVLTDILGTESSATHAEPSTADRLEHRERGA